MLLCLQQHLLYRYNLYYIDGKSSYSLIYIFFELENFIILSNNKEVVFHFPYVVLKKNCKNVDKA